MVYIPGFLINKVYDRGSLKNSGEGFEFRFTNRMTPLKISGMRDVRLEMDGKSYPVENITLELDGKPVGLDGSGVDEKRLFSKQSNLVIKVAGDKLSEGSHVIKVGFITNEYGGATLKVSDTVGRAGYPLLDFVRELGRRLVSGEKDVLGEPLRVEGDFPLLNFALRLLTGDETSHARKKLAAIEGELGGVPLAPDFSRLAAALRREEADRVPLFEAEIAIPIQEWFLGREINGVEDEIEFYIRAGYDFVPVAAPFFAPRLMRTAAADGDGGGDGRAWISESEGIIKTLKDVEQFPWPKAEEVDFSSFYEVARLLPPRMKIIGMLSPAAIFGNTSQSMGLENFSYALFDNLEVVEALFEIIGATYIKIAKRLVRMPRLGAVFMSDDLGYTAGPLVSPEVYRKYVFPWYRRIGEILDGAGLPFIFHSDGCLWDVFDDLADCGIKAVHPIEPLAMDIVEVKKRYGDRFCIFGNIDLEYTLTRGTVDDVRELVKQRLRELAPGGGYGLAASNSVPDYVKPENYRAMVETARKHGKYPIS